MSYHRTEITPELDEYIYRNFSADDEFLASLRRQAMMFKIPDISIAPDQAKFLQFLLRTLNAKYVLEVGTLAGYSAIVMARTLPKDGKLVSIESNNLHYKFACEKIYEADLQDIIEVHHALALDFLADFKPDYPLDFVLLDADKKNLEKYVEICTPLMRKGGVIAIDNSFILGNLTVSDPELDDVHKHRIHDVIAVRKFNEYFRDNPNFESCLLTLGDGMLLGVKV